MLLPGVRACFDGARGPQSGRDGNVGVSRGRFRRDGGRGGREARDESRRRRELTRGGRGDLKLVPHGWGCRDGIGDARAGESSE